MDSYCLAYGQITGFYSLLQLGRLLPNSRLRESSHYWDNQYLLLESSGSRISFERTEKDILISGEADTPERLSSICQEASATLSEHRIRHRMEVYDAAGMLYTYFHFDWLQELLT